ncbi:hypothetical protein C0992_008585 [Termitomyces sp. T32_za158]|nr:hypothetical protein C0992_008585 [Termitomyces sp. T32_za158]
MFAKLPQRFTAPFGILGDEAKLAFPSQPGGITKLATTRHIPENDNYWQQRVLPVVFEVDGEANTFELEVLWKKEETEIEVDRYGNPETAEVPQFVIQDEDETDGEHDEPPLLEDTPPQKKEKQQLPSLGEKLFVSIMDLLFCCGFTLPTTIQVDHHKINYSIWEKGVGSTTDPGPSHPYENNRTEVLRLLLVLLSRQIYVPSGSLFTHPSLYSLYLVQKIPRRDVLTLLCSLLNTAMNSSTSYDTSLGGMAGSVAGKIPYNHLVFKGGDPKSTLVSTCLQVLCVLLDFQSGNARDTVQASGEPVPTSRTNTFRYFLMRLHRSQDFDFIIDGVIGILDQQAAAMNNILPGSRKAVPYINESIIFFWKMIELNKKLRAHVLQSERSMDLIAYLLCYALEIKDKPQQHGLCRALSYIIQTLSAEPGFGLKLTKPVRPQLPAKWSAAGTAGDFIINAIYAIVATTSGTLNSLYPALLIALANAAPHFKDLTVTASTRLIQLFKSFSNPMFLLADEGHPRLLFFMLEVFNAVILHHLKENANLVYGILSAHKAFEDLGTFTLARGLREIKRIQRAKEEQTCKAEDNSKGKTSMNSVIDENPASEKARFLEHEGGAALPGSDSAAAETAKERDPSCAQERDDDSEVSTQSFMSPGSETQSRGGLSEKALGKMRERRSSSMDADNNIDCAAAASVGRSGFVPTQEWV